MRMVVIMYADKMTDSMKFAIDETYRRREIQEAYNQVHGITPTTIKKDIRDLIKASSEADVEEEREVKSIKKMTKDEKKTMIAELEVKMRQAARELDFEQAASLRDVIFELKADL
jgi:excinuclease ABC subunit B